MSVSQLRLSLSGFPEGTAEAPSRPSSRKDRDEGRRSPLSGCTSGSSVGRCPASASKDENAGPVRRDGRVFYRSTKATSKTHAAGRVLPFAVPLAWKPVVLAGRRKSGPASTGPAARSALALLCHCTRRSRNPRKVGGHDPVVELQASVDEGGQALEDEEGGGHGPRGGNGARRCEAVRRLTRRGSASPRRGRGGVLGVQRNGQWRGRHSPENVEFWARNRKDDGAVSRRGRPESAARRWSPSPRPTTGRFSKGSGPTSRQSTSFTPANISAKLPTVATDWYDRAILRDAGVDKVIRALPPRQGDDENGGS